MSVRGEQDQRWMSRAIELAEKGLFSTNPNPRVGCVLVDQAGQLIGEGYHELAGGPHAEVNALNSAGVSARGATAYVTLEPCDHTGRTGACSVALIQAGISRLVYGMQDPNPKVSGAGIRRLVEAGVQVDGPFMESECAALNPGFIKRMLLGRPWVRCKMAVSLDGRTAMENGESKWVTGPEARQDVQSWRARSCAIVTGVNTVLADDPALTVRLPEASRQPLRVVLDSHLRTPAQAKILLQHGEVAIATCAFKRQGYGGSVGMWGMPSQSGRVSLSALLKRLADEQCNEVLVEAGPTLAGAFMAANLVDELILYFAPKLLGNRARPMFELPIAQLAQAPVVDISEVCQIGVDWRMCARLKAEELNQCLPE